MEGTSEKDGWENGDHRRWLRLHLNCFPARSAVSWMVRKGYASSREHAVTLGRALVEAGEIYHVSLEREFNDNDDLFRFVRQSVLVPSTRVGNDNSLLSSPVVTEDGHVVVRLGSALPLSRVSLSLSFSLLRIHTRTHGPLAA